VSLVCPAFAGEFAILSTGFRLYADRHELVGDMVRLHTGSSFTDVPAKDVTGYELEEYVPPPVPAPAIKAEAAVVAPQAAATPQELLADAAAAHGLRPEFVRSVAAVESAYRTAAVSPKGAIGLMQLMPGTAKELGVNPHDPAENAQGGARYLKELLLKYSGTQDPVRLALAAYNAGPGAVDRYGNIPPYRETQAYVEKVLRKYFAELKASGQIRAGT
jgi:soluble lytic murein transglycosylase-like protein